MNNDIDKVVKTVCKIGDMEIKHVTNRKIFNKKDGKYESQIRKMKMNYTRAGVNGLSTIYIEDFYDKIILQSLNPVVATKDSYIPPPSVSFGYGDFTNLKICFDFVKEWFEKDEYRNSLFQYSKDGRPISVSSKYNNLNVKFKSHGGFVNNSIMQIEPSVITSSIIRDSYPGILIRGKGGIVGRCSVTEFYELRDIILNLIHNLYQNSLLLNILGGMCEETKNKKEV